MSEEAPEPTPFPWLPADRVRRWIKALDSVPDYEIEDVRTAAAAWIEQVRRDLFVPGETEDAPAVFTPGPEVVQAGVMAAARLRSRQGSPSGLAAYAEFGAAEVLRNDPDVTRMLRIGAFAQPRVG